MPANKDNSPLGEQVIKTLLYFDIFNYPLKAGEVFTFLRHPTNCLAEIKACLEELTEKKCVFRFGELFSLHPNEHFIHRRIKGNIEAEKWLVVAKKQARFIARFPFVRGVMASGSLSKGYMDENSDLDFFVITAPGKLWIARTLLVLYKRIFLLNSHKRFCVNYFVDENHLEIEERNLFTATELATLVPLYDYGLYQAVLAANGWIKHYLPNFRPRPVCGNSRLVNASLRKAFEYLLQPVATWLDAGFMRMSLRRWNSLYGNQYSKEDFEVAFKSRRHVSKNHPRYYQKKILDLYERKLSEFEHRIAEVNAYE